MKQENKSFRMNDTVAVLLPIVIIGAAFFIFPGAGAVLLIAWIASIYFGGVAVTNSKGETETFRDPATVAHEAKHQAKNAYQAIKDMALDAAVEVNHMQDMRDSKLEILGTSMKEQDERKDKERKEKADKAAEERKAKKAKYAADDAAYRAKYNLPPRS